mmetsp:Transcript_31824/g.63064  ORF Transcript_31824/g.63064 Transcript_31824/m.63064 type:complete len:244 (-) Transcript_31824:151-882(-)
MSDVHLLRNVGAAVVHDDPRGPRALRHRQTPVRVRRHGADGPRQVLLREAEVDESRPRNFRRVQYPRSGHRESVGHSDRHVAGVEAEGRRQGKGGVALVVAEVGLRRRRDGGVTRGEGEGGVARGSGDGGPLLLGRSGRGRILRGARTVRALAVLLLLLLFLFAFLVERRQGGSGRHLPVVVLGRERFEHGRPHVLRPGHDGSVGGGGGEEADAPHRRGGRDEGAAPSPLERGGTGAGRPARR